MKSKTPSSKKTRSVVEKNVVESDTRSIRVAAALQLRLDKLARRLSAQRGQRRCLLKLRRFGVRAEKLQSLQ